MWPLYFLLNKILKTDEDEDQMNTTTRCYGFEHRISHKSMLPRSHFVQVPHVNQLFSWDCGLACVLMALTTIGVNDCSIEYLAELCCTTSIWTVDLAYLLQKFSVRFSYYTVTFGANPNYSGETYYKEQLPNDLVRVDTLFKKAVEAGINIGCRSISGEEISCWILSGKYIAIALVDQYKLRSLCCDMRLRFRNRRVRDQRSREFSGTRQGLIKVSRRSTQILRYRRRSSSDITRGEPETKLLRLIIFYTSCICHDPCHVTVCRALLTISALARI
ncbi:guanylyl cyclase 1 isoform X1 [Gossypium hirsutum]|uniref:Guanylyl cyclase 1 isoform X1 n=2 Tax=Gossypium hirsutum TaxID=3635 RepID=A0ABM3AXZ0_GOSHI|nr:guanylyl cyclase 1 isoform X1 [Gossypium hirsutum]